MRDNHDIIREKISNDKFTEELFANWYYNFIDLLENEKVFTKNTVTFLKNFVVRVEFQNWLKSKKTLSSGQLETSIN